MIYLLSLGINSTCHNVDMVITCIIMCIVEKIRGVMLIL